MGLLPDIARTVPVSIPTAGAAVSAYASGVLVGAGHGGPVRAAAGCPFALLMAVEVFMLRLAALALGPALQTRLMDVAEHAQTLAASLNHSAFNVANALGAWLGDACVASGFG